MRLTGALAGGLLARLGWFALALLASTLIVFAVLDLLPGDAARTILGMNATPEALAALHARLGLDRPAPARYLAWIAALLRGELGTSMTYDVPVAQLLAGRLAITAPLAVLAMALAAAIGLPLGALAARRHRHLDGVALEGGAQLGQAIPDFWLGMALVMAFALHWAWFPSGGFPGWTDPGAALRALLLPALALALPQAAVLTRILRSSLISIEAEDFIRTARARGLAEGQIFLRHALPNALLPVLTIAAMQFSFLIGGAVMVETVFDLPGIGRMLFDAVGGHDLVVLRDLAVLTTAAILAISLAADALGHWLDPRGRRPRLP